jgi:hypothetical protein
MYTTRLSPTFMDGSEHAAAIVAVTYAGRID